MLKKAWVIEVKHVGPISRKVLSKYHLWVKVWGAGQGNVPRQSTMACDRVVETQQSHSYQVRVNADKVSWMSSMMLVDMRKSVRPAKPYHVPREFLGIQL